MVIQSSSPRSCLRNIATLMPRQRAGSVGSSRVPSRVDGVGGSSSRIVRRRPSTPPARSLSESNGSAPTSNSYSITPRE